MSKLAADTTIPSSSPEYHFSFKVVVLGDGAVGKTALLQKEVGSVNTAHSRVGVNFFPKVLQMEQKNLQNRVLGLPWFFALRAVGITLLRRSLGRSFSF